MQNKIEPTLTWQDVSDTINPEQYAQIRGISVGKAREIFNSKNFPRLPRNRNKTTCRQASSKTLWYGN